MVNHIQILFFVCLINVFSKSKSNVSAFGHDFEVVVDILTRKGDMKRIWDNTGLSSPGPGAEAVKYLTSKDMHLNLALIGSLPFKAISHVRIHWLLDLVIVNSTGGEDQLTFDYHLLDNLIQWLRSFRMRPGFELMGNPGNLFSDLNHNPNKVILWQTFMTDLADHFINKFGQAEVKKWRFELWNEPDSKQYNILNLTSSGYLKYAKASMKGLGVKGLKVSGPAGTFKDFEHHTISWSLLQMCNSMISTTGSCGLETITFHKKGEGIAQQVVTSSVEFCSLATRLYPLLKTLPFANNEADILTGWWREEDWRGDVNYAAEVCEVITSFLAEVKLHNLSLAYISNDNGFINQPPAYFNQRTLHTRFQMNTSGDPYSQFIRKPVTVAMGLLSYLGPKEVPVIVRHLKCTSSCDARLSVLAAGDGGVITPGWSLAVVFAVSALHSNCFDKLLQLRIKLPRGVELAVVVYQLDNVLTNPRKVWEQYGKPVFPNAHLLNKMRKQEGPAVILGPTRIAAGSSDWEVIDMPARCPSVTLVHMCVKANKSPAKVLQLRAINITFNEVLLLWQDSDTRCVKTYQVFFCMGDCFSQEYRLITNRTTILLSYQFRASSSLSGPEATRGRYKVRVVDYWDQVGTFSHILVYS